MTEAADPWPSAAAAAERLSRSRPMRVAVPQRRLDDIRRRLREARWPRAAAGAGWRYGVDAAWFRGLVAHWLNGYDWRAREAALNRWVHRTAELDGRRLHFVHVAGSGRAPKPPLLLLHGWPYSFASLLPLAERLARPERFAGGGPDAGFDVVVPSLPGFAFSDAPADSPRGLRFIAGLMHRLMTEVLGYPRYLAHGGDFGAVIADTLALERPEAVSGIHLHMLAWRHAGAAFGSGETGVPDPTPEETAFVREEVANMDRESAYFRLQFTRPETIAYAMADSPVGQAAYIFDKWQKWSDPTRPFEQTYARDALLDEVMLYVATDSFATSIWPYAGFASEPFGLQPGQTVAVPAGYSIFDDPLLPRPPRSFAARSHPRILQWRDHPGGGHFPFLAAPDVLAADIRGFASAALS
jgi:microsomal epoxide hydrolase